MSDYEYFLTLGCFAAGFVLLTYLVWTRHVWLRKAKAAGRRVGRAMSAAAAVRRRKLDEIYGEHLSGRRDIR